MKPIVALLSLLVAVCLLGFAQGNGQATPSQPPAKSSTSDQEEFDQWVKNLPPANPEDPKELVKGNNEFAFDLYRRLAPREGNLVFSPYSISTALAMTYAGARGQTAEEMARTLHFTLEQERLHPAFANLMKELHGHNSPPHTTSPRQCLVGAARPPVSGRVPPFDTRPLRRRPAPGGFRSRSQKRPGLHQQLG